MLKVIGGVALILIMSATVAFGCLLMYYIVLSLKGV